MLFRRRIKMTETLPITTLFLDIGGVLLTNGWDHRMRRRAAETLLKANGNFLLLDRPSFFEN
jgi:hypothetical protein